MISATLPNGLTINRGDAILVQHRGGIYTAHIDRIRDDGGGIFVTANVMTGSYYSTKGGQPATEYGPGYRHYTEPRDQVKAIRFALVSEGQAGYDALLADMAESAKGPQAETESETPEPNADNDPSFSPADLDRMSKEEKKQYKREQRDKTP